MRLLHGFRPPVCTRMVWHSAAHQRHWEDRIRVINDAWPVAERESVRQGVRGACEQLLRQDQYLAILAWATSYGLHVSLLRSVKAFEGFAHRYEPGTDYLVTAIAADREMLRDHVPHLGYPRCCVRAFEALFPIIMDPIWQWAGGPDWGKESGTRRLAVKMAPGCNPLLRYISVRLSPHIPCSATCKQSETLAEQIAGLLPERERADVRELLSLPATWDSYRGVTIVKTEPFRLVVGTDPLADRHIVEAAP